MRDSDRDIRAGRKDAKRGRRAERKAKDAARWGDLNVKPEANDAGE